MYPALVPGDYILVNKWLMGARVFDIWEAVKGKDVKIYRLPGLRKVGRNELLVFHYPYPHRNDSISMDTLAGKMYGRLIAWEQKKPLRLRGDSVFLGDSLICNYRFQENYYFMAGDNLDNSKDSRYWGLVPEPYIVVWPRGRGNLYLSKVRKYAGTE